MADAARPRAMAAAALAVALAGVAVACAGPAQPTPDAGPGGTEAPAAPGGTEAPAAPGASAPPAAEQDAAWRVLEDAPFARIESAVTAHRDEIWVAGGLLASGEATSETWRYAPADGSWREGPPLPDAVHHAALVSTGEELYLIGGYLGAGFGRPTESVLRLEREAWAAAASLPSARAAGAAAWDGERVVYGGGALGGGGLGHEVLAFDGRAWTALGSLSSPREHLAAASDGGGRTWLLGGRMLNLTSNTTTVDLVTAAGVEPIARLPTARGGVAAFHLPGTGACLAGGEEPSRALDAVECVDADGGVTVLPPLAEPRHGHGAAVVDGVAYVLLGGPAPLLTVSPTVQALEIEPATN